MKKPLRRWLNLSLALTFFITAIMLASTLIMGAILYIFLITGVLDEGVRALRDNPVIAMVIVLIANGVVATILATFSGKRMLKRLRSIIKATHQVAQGDFTAKVEEGKGISELMELAHGFNRMTQELSSIETLRSDFVKNFSHEFKTPIVSIQGFAELLINDELSDEERLDYLKIIRDESKRLALLSNNVLTLSRYEATEVIAEKAVFSVDEQIRRMIAMTEPKWSAKDLELDVLLDEVNLNGSADLVQQIWLNLIDNAIKFSHSGGVLAIRLAHWNSGFRFIIKDSGVGMDDRTKSRIFERFYQGDASHAQAGNGLGLAIVKRIVGLCGGRIEVQSELGKGSEFIVWIPIA